MKIRMTYKELFKIVSSHKSEFMGINDEVNAFLESLPGGCGGCFYRRVNHSFGPMVSENVEEFKSRCLKILKKEVEFI
tara:strand:- start:45 stop:278 length:234 start_codon:yes stop_codon:yes gene_type:complete